MTTYMDKSILVHVREGVGLDKEDTAFDSDLLLHINANISRLNQNGIGKTLLITDDSSTWKDFIKEEQYSGNEFFGMVPQFIVLSTKLLFDPPPPSNVDAYQSMSEEYLWRLKVAYEIGD